MLRPKNIMEQTENYWADFGESKDMRNLSRLGLCLLTAGFASASMADVVLDGQAIPSADITAISIDPSSGDIDITTVGGYVFCDDPANCNGSEPPPPPPPPPDPDAPLSVSVSTSAATAELGDSVAISWVTTSAVSCDTLFGNAAWRQYSPSPLSSGSVTLVMDELGDPVSFKLRCYDADGNRMIRGGNVTVTEPVDNTPTDNGDGTAANCPSPKISKQLHSNWYNFFGGEFPLVADSEVFTYVDRTKYQAYSIQTGDFVGNGNITTVPTDDPIRRVSLAECPGIFNGVPENCLRTQWDGAGATQILYWSTDGTPGTCQLDPNKQYWLNITMVKDEDVSPTDSYCTNPTCSTKVRATLSN